mmetsp:Transcript_44118/g.106332  ORF Transcript_44118/g.106332 Transcript_44118/m.106332 type:complete len:326 (-) Transcript_44118:141-1118(-)
MPSYTSSKSTTKQAAAKTLDGRLLCASALAYEIREPYLSGAGFLSTPLQVTKGVNSCLIGPTRDGIVIAFRGTTPEPFDLLQNTSTKLISASRIPKGRVHKGFYTALYNNGLAQEVQKALLKLPCINTTSKYKSRRCKIYLTGHSKGGCLASLFALELLQNPDLPNPEYTCTFGAPRMGDAEFCLYYQQHIRQTTYENHLDIIPFLPPSSRDSPNMTSLMEEVQKDGCQKEASKSSCAAATRQTKKWEYAPIGTRKFISSQGEIVHHVSRDLDNQRIREIEGKTILRLRQFRQAHCSSCPDDTSSGGFCYGGYMKAIAPEICASL